MEDSLAMGDEHLGVKGEEGVMQAGECQFVAKIPALLRRNEYDLLDLFSSIKLDTWNGTERRTTYF